MRTARRLQTFSHQPVKQQEISLQELCQECGATCCKPMLGKSLFDIYVSRKAPLFLKKDLLHLIRKYGSIDDLKTHTTKLTLWYLVPHIFGYCPFLDYPTSSCTIYDEDFRPFTCQMFPFSAGNDEDLSESCMILKHTNKRQIRKKTNQNNSEVHNWGKSVIEAQERLTPIHQKYERQLIADYRFVQHREDIILKVYSPIKESILLNLEAVVEHYAETLSLKELALDVIIIDKDYQLVGLVQGAYRHRCRVSHEDVSRMLGKYAYPGRMTHLIPEMLTTAVYDFELASPPAHWEDCLTIIQKVMEEKSHRHSETIFNGLREIK